MFRLWTVLRLVRFPDPLPMGSQAGNLSMLGLGNVNEITFLVVNLNFFPLHEYPSKMLMESAFQPVLPINF